MNRVRWYQNEVAALPQCQPGILIHCSRHHHWIKRIAPKGVMFTLLRLEVFPKRIGVSTVDVNLVEHLRQGQLCEKP